MQILMAGIYFSFNVWNFGEGAELLTTIQYARACSNDLLERGLDLQ